MSVDCIKKYSKKVPTGYAVSGYLDLLPFAKLGETVETVAISFSSSSEGTFFSTGRRLGTTSYNLVVEL